TRPQAARTPPPGQGRRRPRTRPQAARTRPRAARTRPRAARRRKERTNVSSDSTVREDSSAQSTGLTGGVDIDITGMTCTACARRGGKSLNRLDGATAWVNFATERARVTGLDGPGVALAAVKKGGYGAQVHRPGDDAWSQRAAEVRLSSL